MNTDFYRIKRLPPYIFEEVNRLKAQARARGEDIIDFGMGNPDMPTPDRIVDKLCETARDPRAHRYSASRGIKGLRKAHVAYYKRRFGVELDPDREVIAALGSKEGFANLAMAITAPGDVVLVPNPAYPIHAFGFMIAGAAIRHVPANSPEEYLSKIGTATRHSVPSPLALVVNYPSNPTAQVVSLDFYKEIIKFAKKHEIWVLSDLAYADIYFGDTPPPSILQVEGAKDIAIEFQSLSKTYSMPGWRMGFAAGNEKLIGALARIKSYLDYGAFTPIQVAAAAALNGPQDIVEDIRAVYKSRRDVLVKSMAAAGWNIPPPEASMFAWAPLPEKYKSLGSMEFAKDLLIHAKVAVSPGIGFGEYGEGYVRVALVENEHRIRQAARNVKKFLSMGTNHAPADLADVK
jgi:alanine-synthesizing transaminase